MSTDSEVEKIEAAAKAFEGLGRDGAERAIAWLNDKFVVNGEPKQSAKERMNIAISKATSKAASEASEREREVCALIVEKFPLLLAPALTVEAKDYILRRDLSMSAALRARANKET